MTVVVGSRGRCAVGKHDCVCRVVMMAEAVGVVRHANRLLERMQVVVCGVVVVVVVGLDGVFVNVWRVVNVDLVCAVELLQKQLLLAKVDCDVVQPLCKCVDLARNRAQNAGRVFRVLTRQNVAPNQSAVQHPNKHPIKSVALIAERGLPASASLATDVSRGCRRR